MNLALLTIFVCSLGLLALGLLVVLAWWQVHMHQSTHPLLVAVYSSTVGSILPVATGLFLTGIVGAWVTSHPRVVTTMTERVARKPSAPRVVIAGGGPATASTATPADSTVAIMIGVGPAVDIKADGADGPVTVSAGKSVLYEWTSANATSCQITSPVNLFVPTASPVPATISPGHPFYPTVDNPVIITMVCTDGNTSATDAVTIRLAK